MVMNLITKISPYENMSINNSMWLFYGSLVKQSGTINERPKSISVFLFYKTKIIQKLKLKR